MDKKGLRKAMLQKRNRLEKNYLDRANEKITKDFLASSDYCDCSNIFIYISYSSEVDTQRIIDRALADGKKVLVPRTFPERKEMIALQISNFNTQLCQTCTGILEPNFVDKNAFPPEQIDLIIVPGVAFDPRGYRIGYGGGYYDKYLSLATKAKKIGFAYEESMIEEIPAEEHDQKVDAILTEGGVYSIS